MLVDLNAFCALNILILILMVVTLDISFSRVFPLVWRPLLLHIVNIIIWFSYICLAILHLIFTLLEEANVVAKEED